MRNSADKQITIRIIPFKGTKEEWLMWEEKFLARNRGKGYRDIPKGTENVPKATDVLDTSTEAGKKVQKSRDGNDDAYEDLILSIYGNTKEGRVAFGIIKGYMTMELPDGNACIA